MNNVKWDLIESGSAGADRGVLCLAGALCTGEFFAPRLCGAGVPVWLVLGEHDETGISDDERRTLDACPQVNVRTVAGSTHFIQNWAPATVADITRAALDAVRP